LVISTQIALLLSWLPFSLIIMGTSSQIILNYRVKSTRGLSPNMVFLFFSTIVFFIVYTYTYNLPIAYKVLSIPHLLSVGVLAFQGYYYSDNKKTRRDMLRTYTGLLVFFIGYAITGFFFPLTVGKFSGWASALLPLLTQIPQMLRNARRKSVEGFSFWFVFFATIAVLIELTVVIVLHLPLPSFFSALRGLIYYIIYFGQFILYSTPQNSRISA